MCISFHRGSRRKPARTPHRPPPEAAIPRLLVVADLLVRDRASKEISSRGPRVKPFGAWIFSFKKYCVERKSDVALETASAPANLICRALLKSGAGYRNLAGTYVLFRRACSSAG